MNRQDRSRIMQNVRSKNTGPEKRFRKVLWNAGIRYRTHQTHLSGKPDVVISKHRLIIFVDGDFWHGGQWKVRGLRSLEEQFGSSDSESKAYWIRKIRRNMHHDCLVTGDLLTQGWTVLRFWESDIVKRLDKCLDITKETITMNAANSLNILPNKTFAEFFAGIGLMRMGLEAEGWSITFANDIDPLKQKIYQGHFNDRHEHFILGDIHQISNERVPSVTLATASFPCNDLSLAGARDGLSGKESSAYWEFIRIIKDMGERRPPIILLENVVGFLTSHKGSDFKQALSALNDIGYVVDPFIIDAAKFVPQSRQRLFVVAIREDHISTDRVKDSLRFSEGELRPKPLADFIFTHPEIRWELRNLPALPTRGIGLDDIIEEIPEGSKEWWSADRKHYLLNQMSPRHKAIAEGMIQGNQWSYGTVFRRIRNGKSMAELRTDGIAGCLRTPRGGSGRQILLKAGYGQYHVRLLSALECARLMGADNFRITGTLNQALFGFGDAVCVPVISWITRYYLNPLVNELIHSRPLQFLSGKAAA